ncbi:CAMK family protein kinase [Tritrichomonas foetus]|uniref:CAMK family protein kinase n=1 Tax=Tritrichomonas foetus TaxID=1144522 RepID=A0A1J4L4N2_9EUKA|nr:CAMK family protein kinase [Tritrichomonas foetus]|eukprot:OHT16885.1 CAMK family protein kinase [Tritrichomonas foetus]
MNDTFASPTPPFVCPYTINDYTLVQILGSGAFSVVYKAKKNSTSNFFAMKIIPKKMLIDEKDQKHLQRELDTMVLLKHENIVQLYEFFVDLENFYLVIDYCNGGSLLDVLMTKQKIKETQVATIFKQIVNAVDFCHQHDVAHRDLKPPNILVTVFPNIKLADFGLCGFIVNDGKLNTFCGSPSYTAPECLKMTKYDGKKSDIWSLGVILYELATYEHPWVTGNVPKMIEQIQKARYTIPNTVSPACADLIKQILKVNPNERISTENILNHPWLNLATVRRRSESGSSLPPLNRISVPAIANCHEREKEPKDHGIASPFILLNYVSPKTSNTPIPSVTRSRSSQFHNRTRQSFPGGMKSIVKSNNFNATGILPRKPFGLPIPKRVD